MVLRLKFSEDHQRIYANTSCTVEAVGERQEESTEFEYW